MPVRVAGIGLGLTLQHALVLNPYRPLTQGPYDAAYLYNRNIFFHKINWMDSGFVSDFRGFDAAARFADKPPTPA